MDYYADNKKEIPDLDKIGQWLNTGNKNDFIESVYAQSKNKKLSPRQIDSLNNFIERLSAPPSKLIKFEGDRKEAIFLLLKFVKKYARHSLEMLESFSDRIHNKGNLTEKQYAAIIKIGHRYRKDIYKIAFGEK